MLRKTLVVLLLSLVTSSLYACLAASQNRLFPLGQSSQGLCVLETHLYRREWREKGEEIPTFEVAWLGTSYFKIYDKNHNEVYSELLDSIALFKEQRYESIIGSALEKGLEKAAEYPNFVAAKPISTTFCDYQEACSKAGLLFDTGADKIAVKLQNGIAYEVKALFDTTSIASNLLDYYGVFEEDFSAKSFEGNLYLSSIRQFQVGEEKLTVVHIGSGTFLKSSDGVPNPRGEEYEAEFEFSELKKSVFKEPVLHHGHGFDFYIWE